MSSVYEDCKAAGLKMDSHESDLYIRDTPEAREILRAHNTRVRPFTDNIEHKTWLEVPFGYPHGRGGKRHAPNRLPVAPPPRQHPVHTPSLRAASGPPRESALDRVRRIAARESPGKRIPSPSERQRSSRDLVVNPSKKFKQARGGIVDRDGDSDEIEFIIIEEERRHQIPMNWVLVNPVDYEDMELFFFEFAYGSHLLVWARHMDTAFEEAVSWLSDYAPGTFVADEEIRKLMDETREENPELDDEEAYEAATVDLTSTDSGHLVSYEWSAGEIQPTEPMFEAALEASKEEYDKQYSQSARTAFGEICAEAGSTCVDEETAALSIGREFLPAFALVVLDKSRDLTPREECAYYEWLTAGVQTAIDENAATLAEWSE